MYIVYVYYLREHFTLDIKVIGVVDIKYEGEILAKNYWKEYGYRNSETTFVITPFSVNESYSFEKAEKYRFSILDGEVKSNHLLQGAW